MTTTHSTALAYEIGSPAEQDDGLDVRWRTSTVVLEVSAEAETHFAPGELREAFRAAASAWHLEGVPRLLLQGDPGADGMGSPSGEIILEDSLSDDADELMITRKVYSTNGSGPEWARIEINSKVTLVQISEDTNLPPGVTEVWDLQSVATHEIGHVLGLGHSERNFASMYPSQKPFETYQRDIHEDDLQGMEAIYSEPIDAPEPGLGLCASQPRSRASHGWLSMLGLLALGCLLYRQARWNRR